MTDLRLAKADQAFEQSLQAPILDELDYDLANGESLDAASFCLYLALVTQLLVFFATAELLPRFDPLRGGTEHGVFGIVLIVGTVHDGVTLVKGFLTARSGCDRTI